MFTHSTIADADVMSPGIYLQKRRAHAGFSIGGVARRLAKLPWPIKAEPTLQDLRNITMRLTAAEQLDDHLDDAEVEQLRNIVPLDPRVYRQLVELAEAGEGSGLPVPQLCRECACSFFDPCDTIGGPCSWESSNMCSACARMAAVTRHMAQAAAQTEMEAA